MAFALGLGGIFLGVTTVGGAIYFSLSDNSKKIVNQAVNTTAYGIEQGINMVDGVLSYATGGPVLSPIANVTINPLLSLVKTKKDNYYGIKVDGSIDYDYFLGINTPTNKEDGTIKKLEKLASKIKDSNEKNKILRHLGELADTLNEQKNYPEKQPRLGVAGVACQLLYDEKNPIVQAIEIAAQDPNNNFTEDEKEQIKDLHADIGRNIATSLAKFNLLILLNENSANKELSEYINSKKDTSLTEAGLTTEHYITEDCNILDFLNNDPHGQDVKVLHLKYSSIYIQRDANNQVRSFKLEIAPSMGRIADIENQLLNECQVLALALRILPNAKQLTITIPHLQPPRTVHDEQRMARIAYDACINAGWPPESLKFKFDSYPKEVKLTQDGKKIPDSDINCTGLNLHSYQGERTKDNQTELMAPMARVSMVEESVKNKMKQLRELGAQQSEDVNKAAKSAPINPGAGGRFSP